MSVDKFKFVSPGVFVAEIDNSQLPEIPRGVGPVIIGRSLKGPTLRAIQVRSFSEFVETFGDPIFGGASPDVWRSGPNVSAPSYGTYAAQAYLRNKSPITFVRLAGIQDDNAAPTGNGEAGWQTTGSAMSTAYTTGGGFGLFMVGTGSTTHLDGGVLAAIFYAKDGAVELSGTLVDGTANQTGTCGLFKEQGTNQEYTAQIKDNSGTITDKVVFNFNQNSKRYIRNVFNTNPTLLNADMTANSVEKTYFLGETFDRAVSDNITTASCAVVVGLDSGSNTMQHVQRMQLSSPTTGWFLSQDFGAAGIYTPTNMQKLFRFVGLENGSWPQSNLKISITEVKASPNENKPFGTFTVRVRDISDSDNTMRPVETYADVNLNPNSPNFISRRIGDSYTVWETSKKRYQSYGDYVNQSRYVRVEMDSAVANGTTDPKSLPFGVYGPTRWKGFSALSGNTAPANYAGTTTALNKRYVKGANSVPDTIAGDGALIAFGANATVTTASFQFPQVPTRTNSDDGIITNQKNACFGATTNKSNSNRLDPSLVDLVRRKPNDVDNLSLPEDALEHSWVFSLDDVKEGVSGSLATWASGSRAAGTSFTALGDYKSVLDEGFNKFTTVLQGGFEGLNILEREPFRNTLLSGVDASTQYTYASIERAIDSVADPEVVECNMMTMPGLTETTLTDNLLTVCEARADALAIIDLKGGYQPDTESTESAAQRLGSVADTITQLDNRGINNSYGCSYYPWVQISDTVTTGGSLWVPPSVVALGTFASSEQASELWFAPAGFTRGGLTEGSAGLPVTNIRQRLTSEDRDDLYSANINPIAQFPAEGIVIFGQKTLQVTQSALDRINVRRMLIFVKREISRIASRLLFDQNVQVTWNRFLGQVNPFLSSVRTRLGVTDFKVLLDESTTTPDLVDRNIMYAKIFLKPARAIEFIALDFVVTRSGASFDD